MREIVLPRLPHAESGAAAQTLSKNGFTKVTILDEGFFRWCDAARGEHD